MERRTRRSFLKVSGAGALAVSLAAGCAAPPSAPQATVAPRATPTGVSAPQIAKPEPAAKADQRAPAGQPTTAPVQAAPHRPAPTPAVEPTPKAGSPQQRTLVMIQLGGGDDGLNLLAPYGNGLYYDLRPKVAIAQSDVLPLDTQYGLHPSVKAFKRLYDDGKFAMIQGVGYPQPSRSHFRSMDIWHTARTDANAEQGWLGAFMAEVYKVGDSPFQCVSMGNAIPKAMLSPHAPAAAVQDAEKFQFLTDRKLPTGRDPLLKTFGQVYGKPGRKLPALELIAQGWDATARGVETLGAASAKYQSAAPYPQTPFAKALQNVAQMIVANLGTRVFYVSQGGFDTHSNQKPAHASLLTTVSEGLAAFHRDLEHQGKADSVLILGFSEFGRRFRENGSGGTDHGASGPMFAIGNPVKAGIYGDAPSLSDLDDGDLRYTVDFRQVYATVLENWFAVPSQAILGGTYERLAFLG
jgi:uncharacterized protein (DUF1501 family)